MPAPRIRASVGALALAGGILGSGPAHAVDGLDLSGRARYVVAGDGTPVRVSQTVTVTNRKAPTSTTAYFWDQLWVWLPTKATGLRATVGGSPARVSQQRNLGFRYAVVRFPSRLGFGARTTVVLSYSIAGSPPRSSDPARIGEGYAALPLAAEGDAGRARIEIVSPADMEITAEPAGTTRTSGGTRTTTITGGGANGLIAQVSLRDAERSLEKTIEVGDARFTVAAWPGDRAWLDFVSRTIPKAVPELERLTGRPWAETATTVTQDAGLEVRGYAGTFRREPQGGADSSAIALSEELDTAVLSHELAHAWSSNSALGERWLTEGLAEWLATRTAAALDAPDSEHPDVTPEGDNAFPLAEWDYSGTHSGATADAYGYPAAWRAMTALFTGLPAAKATEVVAKVTTGVTAYDLEGTPRLTHDKPGWRQLYDLLDAAGTDSVDEVMRTWVAPPMAKDPTRHLFDDIDYREASRATYEALDAADGAWAPPVRVRAAMARWDFDVAETSLKATSALSATARLLQEQSAAAGVGIASARTAYERAASRPDYDRLTITLADTRAALTAYGDARAAAGAPDLLERLGARLRPGSGDLGAAAQAIEAGRPAEAHDVIRQVATERAGQQRMGQYAVLTAAVIALALAGGLAWLLLRRRRRAAAA